MPGKRIRITLEAVYNPDTIPEDMVERLKCNVRNAVERGLLLDKDQEAVVETWEVKGWELPDA